MMLLFETYNDYTWLAPYGYSIVFAGFSFYLFKLTENFYATTFNKPMFRNYLVYKKLSATQLSILTKEFSFYNSLSEKHKQQFQHRVSSFISDKEFVGRENLQVSERMKVLISAMGCMLSFGRQNYKYALIDHILIYPSEFYSTINNDYHKGEFNPKGKALVITWKDFEEGYEITDDKLNLGIHEFMHAMQLEAKQSRDIDSSRLTKHFQKILKRLTNQEVKDKLDETQFFRAYAFTNQYEFLAVMAEYFIEAPSDFKNHFPKLYGHTRKLLNFTYGGY